MRYPDINNELTTSSFEFIRAKWRRTRFVVGPALFLFSDPTVKKRLFHFLSTKYSAELIHFELSAFSVFACRMTALFVCFVKREKQRHWLHGRFVIFLISIYELTYLWVLSMPPNHDIHNPLFFLALNKLLSKLIMGSSSGIVVTISIMRMKEKIYQSYLAYMRVFFTFKVIT